MKAVIAVIAAAGLVWGYIPAMGTNDTDRLNLADASSLRLTWPVLGVYSDEVSYQLARTESSGYEVGAIVHFDESSLNDTDNSFTPTPWIALISCDRNTTNASEDMDIFTSARDRGAIAALLYSTKSEACLINPLYTNADEFDQILDIFATKKRSAARLIESQFTNVNKTYHSFNSKLLNESYLAVTNAVNSSNSGSQPPFLMAVLRAWNSTSSPNSNTTQAGPPPTAPHDSGKPNTGLAMIVLYAITGCVSVLFCVVILSGAIRAIRHPERYGPRSGDPNVHGPGGAPQTRAAGLTRAILDTFPVVKFGRPSPPTNRSYEAKDYETKDVELARTSASGADLPTVRLVDTPANGAQPQQAVASGSAPSSPTRPDELTRVAIGVETCPICILDFEEDDDVRVLPCEGRHIFHKACVDQWLLELSSSCPLCREDFAALEAMAAGNHPDDVPAEPAQGHGHSGNRFSKYLRFARHRREQSRGEATSAPQAPIMDPEHETATHWRPRANPNGDESHS
ncbi:unnamed protein product [Rhizoctonia solani]|uniref:RING-type domain-containing protein n=1 Tax=Rhizoctonia solani TaxID=456999 RepID=A0A8H3GI79_9AGAM|nr:unnamed protein product [Rhizoctonia solani]CAE6450220.1 unnamed protein product [Rhizoctonia solani]